MKNLKATLFAAVATISVLAFSLAAADRKSANVSAARSAALSEKPTSTAVAPRTSGFFSADDRMYIIQNGSPTPVTVQYMLRVGPAGIFGFSGSRLPLPEGHMLNAKGQIVPLPKDIKGLPAPTKAPLPPNPEAPLDEPPSN